MATGSAVASAQSPEPNDVRQHKGTILDRLSREPATYRGDGQRRVKWEWYDNIVRLYEYEKDFLLSELSVGETHVLRARWVFKDMRVTFQELFNLPPQSDDKLLPILSHGAVLANAPSSTFEGLALLGKDGELKGTIIRKYMVTAAAAPAIITPSTDPYSFVFVMRPGPPVSESRSLATRPPK